MRSYDIIKWVSVFCIWALSNVYVNSKESLSKKEIFAIVIILILTTILGAIL